MLMDTTGIGEHPLLPNAYRSLDGNIHKKGIDTSHPENSDWDVSFDPRGPHLTFVVGPLFFGVNANFPPVNAPVIDASRALRTIATYSGNDRLLDAISFLDTAETFDADFFVECFGSQFEDVIAVWCAQLHVARGYPLWTGVSSSGTRPGPTPPPPPPPSPPAPPPPPPPPMRPPSTSDPGTGLGSWFGIRVPSLSTPIDAWYDINTYGIRERPSGVQKFHYDDHSVHELIERLSAIARSPGLFHTWMQNALQYNFRLITASPPFELFERTMWQRGRALGLRPVATRCLLLGHSNEEFRARAKIVKIGDVSVTTELHVSLIDKTLFGEPATFSDLGPYVVHDVPDTLPEFDYTADPQVANIVARYLRARYRPEIRPVVRFLYGLKPYLSNYERLTHTYLGSLTDRYAFQCTPLDHPITLEEVETQDVLNMEGWRYQSSTGIDTHDYFPTHPHTSKVQRCVESPRLNQKKKARAMQTRRDMKEMRTHGCVLPTKMRRRTGDGVAAQAQSGWHIPVHHSIDQSSINKLGETLAAAVRSLETSPTATVFRDLASSVSNSAENMSSHIAHLADSASTTTNSVNSLFSGVEEFVKLSKELLKTVVPVALAIWLMQKPGWGYKTLAGASIVSALALMVPPDLWDYIKSYFIMDPFVAQSDLNFAKRTVGVVISSTMAWLGSGGKTPEARWTAGLRNLSSIKGALNSTDELADFVVECMQRTGEYLHDRWGAPAVFMYKCGIKELDDWALKVNSLAKGLNSGEFKVSVETMHTVRGLINQCHDLKGIFRHDHKTMQWIAKFETMLNGITATYRSTLNMVSSDRPEPVAWCIYGPPALGKSVLCKIMMRQILATVLTKERIEQLGGIDKISSDIWSRGVGQFDDGYANQTAAVIDDIGQEREVAGQTRSNYMDVIRFVNCWNAPMNMADLPSKGMFSFTSMLIMMTTNVADFVPHAGNVLVDTGAFLRRIKVPVRIRVRPGFCKPGMACDVAGALDTTKAFPTTGSLPDPNDVWEFQRWDFEGGKPADGGEIISYDDMVAEIVAHYHTAMRTHFSMDEHINDRLRDIYTKRFSAQSPQGLAMLSALPGYSSPRDVPVGEDTMKWHERMMNAATEGYIRFTLWTSQHPLAALLINLCNFAAGYYITKMIIRGITSMFNWVTDLVTTPFKKKTPKEPMHCIAQSAVNKLKKFDKPAQAALVEVFDYFDVDELQSVRVKLEEDGGVVTEHKKKLTFTSFASALARFKNGEKVHKKKLKPDSVPLAVGEPESSSDEEEEPASGSGTSLLSSALGALSTAIGATTDQPTKPDWNKMLFQSQGPTHSKKDGDIEVWMCDDLSIDKAGDLAGLQIAKNLQVNAYSLYVVCSEEDRTWHVNIGWVHGLADRYILAPHHYLATIKHHMAIGDIRGKVCAHLQKVMFPDQLIVFDLNLLNRVIKPPSFDGKDLCLIYIPSIPNCKDITSYFLTEAELKGLDTAMVRLEIPERRGKYSFGWRCVVGQAYVHQAAVRMEHPFGESIIADTVQYRFNTRGGDCGALVYLDDGKRYQGRRIIGMHVAGNNQGFGVASAASREVLQAALREAGAILEAEDTKPHFQSDCFDMPIKGSFSPMYFTDIPLTTSPKTAIKHSPLHNNLGYTSTKAQARLKPFTNENGEMVDPGLEGLRKYASPILVFDVEKVKAAAGDYKKLLLEATHHHRRRVQTFEEACKGDPNIPELHGLKRDTSSGFPWAQDGYGPGKKKFFGEAEEYSFSSPACEKLRKRVEFIISEAKQGRRCLHVFTDFNKDELRTLEKVKAGSTRKISGAPLDYLVAFRMYFGDFMAAVIEAKIASESCVGINPYDLTWDLLGRRLNSKGRKVGAGDYGRYDASAQPQVHDEICTISCEFYALGATDEQLAQLEEDNLVRRVFFAEVYNSRHFSTFLIPDDSGGCKPRGIVYQWHKSLPSGHPMTSICNSMYNSIQFRLCWIDAWGIEHISHFSEEVALADFGDDNVFNVSDKGAPLFNQDTLPDLMANYGMEFTNEMKSGTVATMRDLESVSFLKRRWRFEGGEVNRYIAPLDLGTIREMPYWYRESADKTMTECVKENIIGALMEYSLHDPSIWEIEARRLIRAAGSYRHFPTPIVFQDTRREFFLRKALNQSAPWARELQAPTLPQGLEKDNP